MPRRSIRRAGEPAEGGGDGKRRRIRASSAAPRSPAARFAEYIEELGAAMMDRDARMIRAVLRDPLAMRLPAEVRNEAVAFTRLSRGSLRAPVRTLQYIHRMRQLAADPTWGADSAEQIELFGLPWPGAGEPWKPGTGDDESRGAGPWPL